jgi:hypothetical protein
MHTIHNVQREVEEMKLPIEYGHKRSVKENGGSSGESNEAIASSPRSSIASYLYI